MQRLITAFRKLPSPSNRRKIEDYAKRHPMALCTLSPDELAFLRTNGFKL